MNWEFGVDLKTIVHHVETAQTFSVFFPSLRKSLLVDMRQGLEEGPLVRVLPMARSPHDRLRSLRRLRPNLPRANEMVAIPWPTYVENLVRSGVWERVAQRVADSGSADATRAVANALAELRQHESKELASLIRGDNYETLWTREEQ